MLKSTNRGEGLYPISPDLTTQDAERIRISTETTGGITRDVTNAETHSTITALAESPIRPGLLYAGTDDGNVWLTRNDGGDWDELTGRFPGVPAKTWVSRIEPSHHDSAAFYVSFDGHRENDFAPYVYVTHDFGATFRSIANDLPTGGPNFIHVIREDPHNADLLFVGTDVGVYVSTDRGASWQRFMEGLPTVPVHDLKIHPRDRELIAGTHGRSIWIVDIATLEQLTNEVLAADAYLFEPKTAYQYNSPPRGGQNYGHDVFEAQSPRYGAEIVYRRTSGERRTQTPIVITNVMGDTVQTLQGPGTPGIHRVTWNFRGAPAPRDPLSPSQQRDSVLFLRRLDVVFDSVAEAGTPRQMLDRIRNGIASGNTDQLRRLAGFGGGGGGGAFGRGQRNPGQFNERPGESRARGQRGPGARGGGQGGARAAGGQGEPSGGAGGGFAGAGREMMRDIFRLFRRDRELRRYSSAFGLGGFGFGGRGRGGGGGSLVETGDYLVSVTIDDETMRRVLRVERVSGGRNGGVAFEEEER